MQESSYCCHATSYTCTLTVGAHCVNDNKNKLYQVPGTVSDASNMAIASLSYTIISGASCLLGPNKLFTGSSLASHVIPSRPTATT